MSTAAVSSTSISQQLQQYFQTRASDLKQLGTALQNGNLAGAQTAYNNIVQLGQTGPAANGNPFLISQREQDFTAIGTALQSGDLAGAQQAFATLRGSAEAQASGGSVNNGLITAPSSTGPTSAGPEIILNLSGAGGTSANPEQITINLTPTSGGGEQVALSVGGQGSTPQEITFNLNANSNEQIVLNLLGASSSGATSSTASSSSSALSVTA
jgi:hypothetical protein